MALTTKEWAVIAGDSSVAKSFATDLAPVMDSLQTAASDNNDLKEASQTVNSAATMLLRGLVATGKCKAPEAADWGSILDPVMDLSRKTGKSYDKSNESFDSRKAAEESIMVVSMLAQADPVEYTAGVIGSVDFYITKACQSKKVPDVAWAKALKTLLETLQKWAQANGKGGFKWAGSQEAKAYFVETPLGPRSTPDELEKTKPKKKLGKLAAGAGEGMAGLFGSIGAFGTEKLNHVSKEMRKKDKTAVPAAKQPAGPPAPKVPAGKGPKGEPTCALRGQTWNVENQDGNKGLKLDDVTISNMVYIVNCINSTIIISKKVKNITLDNCWKVNIVSGDVLSAVECVNSDRCQFQTTGQVNTIAIDKCTGITLHLSKESLEAKITTSKSSEMNVNIPNPDDPDDMIEMPIPEQFVTSIQGKALKTEVSDLYTS